MVREAWEGAASAMQCSHALYQRVASVPVVAGPARGGGGIQLACPFVAFVALQSISRDSGWSEQPSTRTSSCAPRRDATVPCEVVLRAWPARLITCAPLLLVRSNRSTEEVAGPRGSRF